MTHVREDTDCVEPKQAEPLQIKLPGGLWLEMADSWTNRRGLMIFLRCLRRPDGRPLLTYEQIANQLGYPDRRNVHNFWMEFEACGEDLDAFLRRRKKVDENLVGQCEQIWKVHPLWRVDQVHAEFVRQFPEQAERIAPHNVRTAGHQIGFLGIQQVLCRQLAEGQLHVQEPVLLEALFELADAGARVQADQVGQVDLIPEVLEAIRPEGAPQPVAPAAKAATTEALKTAFFEGDVSPAGLKTLWEGVTGQVMVAFMLYYHGLSLEAISSFFGVHKTTVMRWLEPLSDLPWQEVVAKGQRFFSGILAVDEKWIQIHGVWWYLFVAVDHVSGFPLHVALFPSNSRDDCQAFLLQVKALGYTPKIVITDGWDAYVKAIARVFPNAEHLLCRFHAIKAAFRRLKKAIPNWKGRKEWAEKIKKLFHTPSKRTVKRRLARHQAQAEGTPAAGVFTRFAAKLPQLLPAVGSTFRPSTTNAAERFLGAFDRFYQLKGPFQNEASAQKHIRLFMLGYVFHALSSQAQAEKQGLCPLQLAGYRVSHIPFFHMFNRPDVTLLQKRMADQYAQVA
jgi:transposase-like protein